MPIRFPQLLQDSWNFLRNHRPFTAMGFALLFVVQLANSYFTQDIQQFDPQGLQQSAELDNSLLLQFPAMLIAGALGVLVNILVVLNIKAINNGTYQRFFQPLNLGIRAFFPTLLLTIVMIMPMSLAISFTTFIASGAGIVMLPLLFVAVFIFMRLCLVVFAYLIEEPQKGIGESIKFIWHLSRGKMRLLVQFCVLSYLVPSILNVVLLSLLGGGLGLMVAQILGTAISLYVTVFGFRFYQAIRALA